MVQGVVVYCLHLPYMYDGVYLQSKSDYNDLHCHTDVPVLVCTIYNIHRASVLPVMNNIHRPFHLLWYNIY